MNIMTIPYHLGGWQIIYDTVHNHLHPTFWESHSDVEKLNQYLYKYPCLDVFKIKLIKESFPLDKIYIMESALPSEFPKYIKAVPLRPGSNVYELLVQ